MPSSANILLRTVHVPFLAMWPNKQDTTSTLAVHKFQTMNSLSVLLLGSHRPQTRPMLITDMKKIYAALAGLSPSLSYSTLRQGKYSANNLKKITYNLERV